MELRHWSLPWAPSVALLLLLLGPAMASPPPAGDDSAPTILRSTQDPEGISEDPRVTPLGSSAQTPPGLRTTRTRILFEEGPDYGDYDADTEDPSAAVSTYSPAHPCDYDRCRHLQVPCEELQHLSQCLCPGISGPSIRPDPPRLGEVRATEGTITLHWCAPSSAVDGYRVELRTDGASEATREAILNATSRLATLDGLRPGTAYMVCVMAVNRAGASEVSWAEFGPCRAVQTTDSKHYHLYVSLGVIAAVLVLAGASIMAYYCQRRKGKAIIMGGEGSSGPAGVPNMSYRSESMDQL